MTVKKIRKYKKELSKIFIEKAQEYWKDIDFSDCQTYIHLKYKTNMNNEWIDEDYLELLFDYLKTLQQFKGFEYQFNTEDYWLDGSESIWQKYLIFYYLGIEYYKISFDELQSDKGFQMLMRIILYYLCQVDSARKITRLIPIKHYE